MAFEKFKKIKFTARTASAGTKFKPYYQGISRILKTGGQSKGQGGFFDYKRAAKNPDKYHVEVDEATGERATYIERNEYREQMLTAITGSFGLPDSITASISASFFSQIGDAVSNLPPGEFVAILSSPTNERPTASFGLKKNFRNIKPWKNDIF